jgi:hypothetical protein
VPQSGLRRVARVARTVGHHRLESLSIKGIREHRGRHYFDVPRVARRRYPVLWRRFVDLGPVVAKSVRVARSSLHDESVTMDEDANVVAHDVRCTQCRSLLEMLRLQRVATRGEPQVTVQKQPVNGRAAWLP